MRNTLFIAAGAAIAAAAIAASAATPASTSRLSATIAARPDVSGFFLATLEGRTLTWRLTVDGARGKPSAQVRLVRSGAAAATLCASCAKTTRGTTKLTDRAAAALASGKAYLAVRVAEDAGAPVLGRVVEGWPTLEITSLHPGDTIRLPAAVSYSVSSFALGRSPLGHIELWATQFDHTVELPPGDEPGRFTIPDAKSWYLVGRRDLTFTLATADGTLLPNAGARVTIRDVRIEGRK